MTKDLQSTFSAIRSLLRLPENRDYLHEAPRIPQALLESCKLYSDRRELINSISTHLGNQSGNLVIAEIGTLSGGFAHYLGTAIRPSKMIVVDISFAKLEESRFIAPLRELGMQVDLIEERSTDAIHQFEDNSLDLAYIDASHTLEAVRQDLASISKKIKPGGFLVCNDYISFSLFDTCNYGVPRAFNEFITERGWPVIGFAMERYGYHDIATQKPA